MKVAKRYEASLASRVFTTFRPSKHVVRYDNSAFGAGEFQAQFSESQLFKTILNILIWRCNMSFRIGFTYANDKTLVPPTRNVWF